MTRITAPGVVDGLKAGLVIGLPCVMKYAIVKYLIKEICLRKSLSRSFGWIKKNLFGYNVCSRKESLWKVLHRKRY